MMLSLSANNINGIHSIMKSIDSIESNSDPCFEDYPKYQNLLNIYREVLLKMLDSKETINIRTDLGELYCREHIFPDGNVVDFAWSIPVLQRLIQNNPKQVVRKKFKIGELNEFIDYSGLETNRFSYALKNSKPVLVIDYSPSNLQVLIDGNHRVAARLHKFRDADMLVSGIYIPAEIHVKSMASDFQKTFFKVFANVGRIFLFLDMKSKGNKVTQPKLFNLSTYI
ncbi:hypothetical protein [Bacillus sp. FJAT-26390]|uniref:hypothetical protein n=1 Tax=Bacillus sp. FJAT-26390 TaxID=1743142 RepID=UPI000807CDA8|nr:hypothetical protein [Bacillus sp. FJAT-26390]OBZ10879.1 hypothetical protein A7975_17910 [Bacillus sp. FJAT-26390]